MSPTKKQKEKLENKKPTGTAMIYHHSISNKISKHLRKHNISMIYSQKRETAGVEVYQGWLRSIGPGHVLDSVCIRQGVCWREWKDY
jgi:hypothetical protein